MANSTVYPYGTGGSLPSSIGLVNDLKTGGVDKALTAQQGVVLNDMIQDAEYDSRDISITQYLHTVTTHYIKASTNTWDSSNSTHSLFIPIIPGYKYKLTAILTGTTNSRYALLKSNNYSLGGTPDYATGESAIHYVAVGESAEFIAPDDAHLLIVNKDLSNTDITPSALVEMAPDEMLAAEKAMDIKYQLFIGSIVDARTDSETFGQAIAGTNNSWGISQFIDLSGASRVRYFANTFSTSNNYAGVTGTVYYDKDMIPMTAGARLMLNGSPAFAQWIDEAIPDGAKYMRVTVSVGYDNRYLVRLYNAPEHPSIYKDYYGEKITFEKTKGYAWHSVASNGMIGQSAAIYDKYLFIVANSLSKVMLYDMEALAPIYTLTTGLTAGSNWHCNQSSFSPNKYAETDMFPVLFISQRNDGNGRGVVQGYRIIPTLEDNVITSFTITLVQTILLPAMTDTNCLGYPNIAFDTEGNFMWAYSRNNNSEAANVSKARFTRFAIPALFDGSSNPITEVTLEDSDIKEAFSDEWRMVNAQGGCIKGGKLYIMQGYPSVNYVYLRVEDLYAQKRQVSFANMLADGITAEPEGVFFYDGTIYFTANSTTIYKLFFD